MTIRLGTRTLQGQRKEHVNSRHVEESYTRDVGMNMSVSASITFSAGSSQLQAANGTFTSFVAGEPIFVSGSNKNDGEFMVTAIDGTNQSYLTTDPAPTNEGPLTVTVRTT